MRIIREGKIPESVPRQARCWRCSTLIEFEPREAKRVYDQRDGDYYTIPCPLCGNQITSPVYTASGSER